MLGVAFFYLFNSEFRISFTTLLHRTTTICLRIKIAAILQPKKRVL